MLQDQPGMDQIELARGHILALQVMAGDGDIGTAQARQAADVDISGQDRAAVSHLAGQPCRHRSTSGACLPAPPALRQPQLPYNSPADRIKLALQRRQPVILPPPRPREHIPAHVQTLAATSTANTARRTRPEQDSPTRKALRNALI